MLLSLCFLISFVDHGHDDIVSALGLKYKDNYEDYLLKTTKKVMLQGIHQF